MTLPHGVYERTLIGRVRKILIDYVDVNGVATTREIVPFMVRGEIGESQTLIVTHVHARCLTAKARRTFRVDRIEAMEDSETGETLTLLPWLRSLEMGAPIPTKLDAPVHDTSEPQIEYVEIRRGPRWRWLIILLVVGYVIGRYRLIRWALRAAGLHWGLWL